MNYLLDTSVVSQLAKSLPHPSVSKWMGRMSVQSMGISAITLTELRFGTEWMPAGKRRRSLENWIGNVLPLDFAGRILPISPAIADRAGVLGASTKRAGANLDLADLLIAATAQLHSLRVVTLNRKHFVHLGVELEELPLS